jgi:glucosyl-3-phosphoglycerate phosphatase
LLAVRDRMSRLLVWRHARTEWNATRRVQGQTDVALDEVGIAQAAEAAVRVAQRHPSVIISSDLRRASMTAQPLADLTGLPVRLDARLRERHFGPWQGLTDVEIRERYPEDFARWGTDGMTNPEIETVDDMTKRVSGAFRDAIDSLSADGVVVLVTHGGSAKVGIASLLGWPDPVWRTLGGLHNCHWAELTHSVTRGWQLTGFNVA